MYSLKKNDFPLKKGKNIFYLNIPEYGNMGDQAIVLSTLYYIKENFPQYNIVNIHLNDIYKMIGFLKENCTEKDLIFLQGGGNVGTLYWKEEKARRIVIKNLKKCRIISMPQSVFFSTDKKGLKELKKSQKNYNNNKKLVFFAREKYSYEFIKKNFNCKVVLIPDIVFLLGKYFNSEITKGDEKITVCLRADKETDLGISGRAILLHNLEKVFKEKLFLFDTTVNREIPDLTRELEICSLLREFSRARLLITDRLHGMIFAAITQTPCIVMKSLDTKIVGSYEWIKSLNYIKFLKDDDINSVLGAYRELSNIEQLDNFRESFNFNEYKKIKDEINK